MIRGRLRRISRGERGVAMVTVLFVGATLTAVTSVAALATIDELRASTEDRRSAQALSFAEAGVDRMLNYLRSGKVSWADLSLAGCPAAGRWAGETDHPAVTLPTSSEAQVGSGSYSVRFEVFNPTTTDPTKRFAPGACTDLSYPRRWETPKLPGGFWSGDAQYFAIISTGASAASSTPCPDLSGGACRTVHQVVRIKGVGLPVGIYAKNSIDANGTPKMESLSMITPGNVTGREKIAFSGADKYYFLSDFGWTGMSNASSTYAPAAIHAGGSIALKSVLSVNTLEHPTKSGLFGTTTYLNCDANRSAGTAGQSQWDQSGPGYGGPITEPKCSNWTGSPAGPPPTSEITAAQLNGVAPSPDLTQQDHDALRATAAADGIYCSMNTTTPALSFCKRKGANWPVPASTAAISTTDFTSAPALDNTFIFYVDFDKAPLTSAQYNAQTVKWSASWKPCTDDPATSKQVLIVIRNGNFEMQGGTDIHGAIIVPEGDVNESGNANIEGTIIAKTFRNRGGGTFKLTDCAIRSLPIPWLDISPFAWSEIDR